MSPASALPRQLESAFADHHAFVRERLRCLGVAASDLDDATQDVFEVLVRRIADYDRERPLRSWMAGIARRVARRYRDRGRRSVLPLDERIAIELSPEDRAAEAEARALLQRFLAELEPERWSVFVLSEIEGRVRPPALGSDRVRADAATPAGARASGPDAAGGLAVELAPAVLVRVARQRHARLDDGGRGRRCELQR